MPGRTVREEKTFQAMIKLYCRDKHGTKDSLCPGCAELAAYAMSRLANCPFQEAKTPCAKCRVHCYKPVMRDQVREVMRYSGPHMACRHPVLAFFHFMDGFKQPGKRRERI
ncbi:MAG TPA: nitrous oxide-stimulated promoter family protein [Dissulfurispiraceae bacterium]|nr:nitrous oxide-stimulated promoter family protein [Dissulfurispiraceae bacterium]